MGLNKDSKGSAFIIVILCMAVMLVLAMTVASIAASSFEMGHAERRYQAAYYVAEAGIRHQIEHMRLRMEEIHSRTLPPANADAFFTAYNSPVAQVVAAPLIMQNLGNDAARAVISMIAPPGTPAGTPVIPVNGNPRTYYFTSSATVGNVNRMIQGSVRIEWRQTLPEFIVNPWQEPYL